MSGFASEPVRSEEHELASVRDGTQSALQGQRHDRIPSDSGRGNSVTMVRMDNIEPEKETEISASQKMLSAVSGSLLTSLLGMFILHHSNLLYGLMY